MNRSRSILVSALVPVLAVLILALPARAILWCKADPVVTLNGTSVRIDVAIPEEFLPLVTGPTYVEVNTPEGVVRQLVYTDAGFNDYGEEVVFGDLRGSITGGAFPTQIWVKVPIHKAEVRVIPVQVTITPDNAGTTVVYGTSSGTEANIRVTGR